MKRLYDQNELLFAILTIMIYVVVMGNLQVNFGAGSIYSLLGIGIILIVLSIFLIKNKLLTYYGFILIQDIKKYQYFIPLMMIASVNLWFGIQYHYDTIHSIIAVLMMACTGFVEEIIFRGLLFKAIAKDNLKEAILISSITFGMGHIVNLFTGNASMDTYLQIGYAIAIGLCFVMLFYKSGSIIPCILTHSFINMTAELSKSGSVISNVVQVLFLIVVSLGYSYYLKVYID